MGIYDISETRRLNGIVAKAHDDHDWPRRKVAPDTHFLYGIDGERSVIDVADEMSHELAVLDFLIDNAEGGDEVAYLESQRAMASAICDAAVMEF